MIGTRTYEGGDQPTGVVLNGATYSWNANTFVGPGITNAIPVSADSAPPLLTAGGQVFLVQSSLLEVTSTAFEIPASGKPSPFLHDGQQFYVDHSRLIAADRNIPLTPSVTPAPFVYKHKTYSFDASHVYAGSTTLPLTRSAGQIIEDGQTLEIGPSKVIGPSTTIILPASPILEGGQNMQTFTVGGQVVQLGPAGVVIGSQSYPLIPGAAPKTYDDHGRKILLGPSGIEYAGTSISIPSPVPIYSVTTENGLTLSLSPSEVVLNGHTNPVAQGASTTTTTTIADGRTVEIGAHGVLVGGHTIPLPTTSASYSIVSQGDLTFSVAPSQVIISGSTVPILPHMTHINQVIAGQTIDIGPSSVRIAGTTVSLPTQTPELHPVTADGLILSVGQSQVLISGSTYNIGSGASATRQVTFGSETIQIGTAGIILPTTTIAPAVPDQIITAAGVEFHIGPSYVAISGSTYPIGPGAPTNHIVIGNQTVAIDSNGVNLPSTTLAPEQIPTPITTDGLTFAVDATQAVINGTTYAIGPAAATATSDDDGVIYGDGGEHTIVQGNRTIILGTEGVVIGSSDTIQPWTFSSTVSTTTALAPSDSGFWTSATSANLGALPPSSTATNSKHGNSGQSLLNPLTNLKKDGPMMLMSLVLGSSILLLIVV